jgi:hypothetical protein
MAQLSFETILLLESFGNLYEGVNAGDQVLVRTDQLGILMAVLDKNHLLYETVPYDGLNRTTLILNKQ